jgi:thiol-disulfide isomerase/thioredoxin
MPDAPARPAGSWRSFLLGLGAGVVLTLALLLGALFTAAFAFRTEFVQQKAERLKPPPLAPDAQADYAWSLTNAQGATVPAETFAGKTWFLHFWSPECTACEAEIPDLNRLHASLGGEAIAFAAVSLGGDAADLAGLSQRLGITYPIYAVSGELPEVFRVKAGPATFIAAPDGRLVFKHIGAARWSDPSAEFYLKSLTVLE